ncbi:hypothetical protein P344_00410 [Spiroplasma mirum ATCC 29335]|uniref:Phosphomannose isomerase type I catalytic domain-containing protein n=1 Tax=Spiroplasma mirum ATCC 29335 TaxID=838561 RepID=W0GJW3_9MOLU|nr:MULTISPECIES: type I phosphomannose isomerase catalytic subunit [Spiroplasma]AHF60545.1 mannose-6-phosphate isomerase [Spiroplasma mirum ATCC 29335]AHI57456.1 hypothetical protein P344_00410 [Spiroplasma mirum ATCC 29335]AKM52668.1 mannose-6-phosphate isomerase [Spiroplasma atrichopogonis]
MYKMIKITPFFSERLWGGRKLEEYGFKLPANQLIGEAWVVSALDNGMGYVQNGEYQGLSLKELYEKHHDLFNDNNSQFPLLSKIITANDYLSVQVHPDDKYSLAHDGMLGKPECWYIINCPEDAELIYGHHAKTKSELIDFVKNKQWIELFVKVKIKKGDFLYVPPGKIHAITPGVTVFELQRSSDVTYRFYDFDRKDQDGNLRPLHIQECLDVTTVPDPQLPVIHKKQGLLIDNEYFTLYLIKSDQHLELPNVNWAQVTLLKGTAVINGEQLLAGESAILVDFNNNLTIKTAGELLLSYKK